MVFKFVTVTKKSTKLTCHGGKTMYTNVYIKGHIKVYIKRKHSNVSPRLEMSSR